MSIGIAVSAGHGQKKSRRREIAIGCLLAFPTVKSAAKAAGIAEITLHRWLKDPQFAGDYQRARERILETASEQLRSGTLQAVAVLREVIGNRKAPCASRVMAARTFLESTALLRGTAVAVTVNNEFPRDPESLNRALVEELSKMLQDNPPFRAVVRDMISNIESGKVN
jgi:hypothetical protein